MYMALHAYNELGDRKRLKSNLLLSFDNRQKYQKSICIHFFFQKTVSTRLYTIYKLIYVILYYIIYTYNNHSPHNPYNVIYRFVLC